jgi:hypothetical protein
MVVELGWQLKLNFKGGLAWGCVGEVRPSLYKGVDNKREVICIHFGHP